jgi:ubiquinone/menaquinone biosynthesis C-methylase UbiE
MISNYCLPGDIGSMKMTKLEKRFVNSKRHSRNNIELVESLIQLINMAGIERVLEVGCGFGTVAAHLTERHSLHVAGSDVDPDQIQLAKTVNQTSPCLQFLTADATKLPFEEQSFDMVLSFKVMHHIPGWESVLKEISRVVKPGGYYLFNDLACTSFTKKILRTIIKKAGIYTCNDITTILEKYGLMLVNSLAPDGFLVEHHSFVFRKI